MSSLPSPILLNSLQVNDHLNGFINYMYKRAGLIWIIDILGAALFGWGIAGGVAALVAGAQRAEYAAAMLAGALLRGASVVLVQRAATTRAQANANGWRERAVTALLGGRTATALSTGESAALAIDHVRAIEEYGVRFEPARLGAVLGPVLAIALVAVASWVSAAILLATTAPFVLGMILAGTAARRASDQQLAALTALSGLYVDRVRHLPLIRHFGAEARIVRQVTGATREVATRTVAVLRAAFLSSAVLEFFSALAVALVAVYCGFSLLGLLPFTQPEHLSLERAFFALAMAPEVYLPMRRLAAAYHEKQVGEAAMAQLEPIVAQPPSISSTAPPPPFSGAAIERLEIAWPHGRVGPLDLTIGVTDFVALTGPTGSGKSTTLAAIAGQVDPAAGRVATPEGDCLAPGHVAWAAQRPLLLTASLRRNLALAAPDASEADILAAAGRVGLGPMLERRGGLDLAIDHAGSGLSGGERRRIGLARAILSRRPLLLCDEPTADLDDASAAQILALLRELSQTRAVVVATHDPAVAAAARLEIALETAL